MAGFQREPATCCLWDLLHLWELMETENKEARADVPYKWDQGSAGTMVLRQMNSRQKWSETGRQSRTEIRTNHQERFVNFSGETSSQEGSQWQTKAGIPSGTQGTQWVYCLATAWVKDSLLEMADPKQLRHHGPPVLGDDLWKLTSRSPLCSFHSSRVEPLQRALTSGRNQRGEMTRASPPPSVLIDSYTKCHYHRSIYLSSSYFIAKVSWPS